MNVNIKQFLKVFLTFILAMVAIISNVEIFNLKAGGFTDGFHVVCAGVNFAVEAYLIYKYAKNNLFKNNPY